MSVSISEGAKFDFDAIASGGPAFAQRMQDLATKIAEARDLRAAAEKMMVEARELQAAAETMMAEADRRNRIEAERLRSAQEETAAAKARFDGLYAEIMAIAAEVPR